MHLHLISSQISTRTKSSLQTIASELISLGENARGLRRRRTPLDGTKTQEEKLFKNATEDFAAFWDPARSFRNDDGSHYGSALAVMDNSGGEVFGERRKKGERIEIRKM